MVREEATLENEGLRWFRRALAAEQMLDALRARVPENVSDLRPRSQRAARCRANQSSVRRQPSAAASRT